jgi:hypothetical protein
VLKFLPAPGALPPALATPKLPVTIVANLADFGCGVATCDGKGTVDPALKTALDVYSLKTGLSCSPRKGAAAGGPEIVKADDATTGGVYNGIVVSASRACRLTVQKLPKAGADNGWLGLADTSFWAQDSRVLMLLPTNRGLFVNRATEYDFASGQATAVTDTRPSEAAAFVALPGSIVGAFFSGVTTAFTNKKSVVDAQTAQVTAQSNMLTAQANYLTAQATLAKAQKDAAAAAAAAATTTPAPAASTSP